MDPSGQLNLQVRCEGARVVAVGVSNDRPRASHLLEGLEPGELLDAASRLFAVCGRSQRAAAAAAWAAATGEPGEEQQAEASGRDEAICLESIQEALWRLLVDWPMLLGLPPSPSTAVAWHRRLAGAAELGGQEQQRAGRELAAGLATELLGHGAWPQDGAEPLAREGLLSDLLAALERIEPAGTSAPCAAGVPLQNAWRTAAHLRWPLDEDFCAAPTWDGAAAETGPLASRLDHPALRRLVEAGRQVAARLAARALALADDIRHLAGDPRPDRLADAARLPDGSGLARVETARGALIHWVRPAAGRSERYAIVAPTEWNFHPDGPFATGALGARCRDEPTLRLYLHALALSLDPCVEHRIGVARA